MTESGDQLQPASEQELARMIQQLQTPGGSAIVACGGRTSLGFGGVVRQPTTSISLSGLSTIDDYPARDMTITVGAGCRVDELQQQLAEEHQQLPIDIPQSARATIGGALACNSSGPRRFGYGTLRDYVIGLRAVDGRGRVFGAGGRVVKNVAGYDICKLLIGSVGTLAIVTQVTLKLKPIPESSGLLWINLPGYDDIDVALETLIHSRTRPRSMDVLSPVAAGSLGRELGLECPGQTPVLCLGFDGTQDEVDWQLQTALQELQPFGPVDSCQLGSDDTRAYWNAVAEFSVGHDSPLVCQTTVVPSGALEVLAEADQMGASSIACAGNGIVTSQSPEALVSKQAATDFVARLEQSAAHHAGRVHVLDCQPDWSDALPVSPMTSGTLQLASRIKHQLDPHDLLAPGRIQYAPPTPAETATPSPHQNPEISSGGQHA